MTQVHEKRHVQAALSRPEYERFRRAAKRRGLTIQGALRRAALRWMYDEGGEADPFLALVGKYSGPSDASETVDEIYDED